MKSECEKCHRPLTGDGIAFICSYECTFCQNCAVAIRNICPNCNGELLRRPRRVTTSSVPATT
ncbi:MAG TPA: DUF1272 domain-containing protein [Alphaproteobacteria bacterium]|nr:DUF1272 domain-containing protein [Alphaproteobacteria bacterium]